MPQFSSGEQKTAIAPITVKPSGLSCSAELYLASNSTKVATSGLIPFTSTGVSQDSSLPVTMPETEGTYPVFIDVYAEDTLIVAHQAIEDVVILPVTANLLLNPGFEDELTGWTVYSNYPGRSYWFSSDKYPRTGLKSALFSASAGGRSIVCTLSQVVPWKDEYRGQTFNLAAWRSIQTIGRGHDREGRFAIIIDDGVGITENEIYIYPSAYVEQAVARTLSPNANKLEVIFRMIPHRNWSGSGLYVDDTILEQL